MKLPNLLFYLIIISTQIACQSNQEIASPPQYNLNKPLVYKMPEALNEISGIAFSNDRNDLIYAVQDESGLLYEYDLENSRAKEFKFSKKGDFEDIAITDELIIVLKSNGTLYTFSLDDVVSNKETNVQELKDILPKGEYEGLYMDNVKRNLYVLCKNCSDDKENKTSSGYILTVEPKGQIIQNGQFSINVKDIEKMAKVESLHFQPSALAKNKETNEWYIISSANNAFVVTDASWAVKAVYPLPKSAFRQPEGISFDSQNNLYISNEKASGNSGNVLKFLLNKNN